MKEEACLLTLVQVLLELICIGEIPFSLFHFCALGLQHSLFAVKIGGFMFVCFYLNTQ